MSASPERISSEEYEPEEGPFEPSQEVIDSAVEQARSLRHLNVYHGDRSLNIEETRRQRQRIVDQRLAPYVQYFPKGYGIREDERQLPVYGKLENET